MKFPAGIGGAGWVALLAVSSVLYGADEPAKDAGSPQDNPYKNMKVGQWVEYKVTSETMGQKNETKMKQTVKAKDEKTVTLISDMEFAGNKHSSEQVIRFDQPFKNPGMPKEVTPKEIAKGDETVTLGAKTYACKWVEVEVTVKQEGTDSVSRVKTWTCSDVPLGMVKTESKTTLNVAGQSMVTSSVQELTGFGN